MGIEYRDITSLDVARCAHNGACKAEILPGDGKPLLHVCRSQDCGRPLREAFLATSGRQIENWRQARWRAGEVLTLGAMSEEVARRWPVLSRAQAHQVVAAADRANRMAGAIQA